MDQLQLATWHPDVVSCRIFQISGSDPVPDLVSLVQGETTRRSLI
jgi:hypothetical protein